MKLEIIFSDLKLDYLSADNPILPFCVSFYFLEEGATLANPTVFFENPGCLFAPLDEGPDGLAGMIWMPKHYPFRGVRRIPNPKIGPAKFLLRLCQLLRAHSEVRAWKSRLLGIYGNSRISLNKKAEDKIAVWKKKNDPFLFPRMATKAEAKASREARTVEEILKQI